MTTAEKLRPTNLFWLTSIAGLGLTGLGVATFFSAVFTIQTDRFLEYWATVSKRATPTSISAAQEYSQKAVFFFPGTDGRTLLAQARVYEWQSLAEYSSDQDKLLSVSKNKEKLLLAGHMKPLWLPIWTDLVRVKFRLNEIDKEFYSALDYAEEAGPWRSGNLQRIARLKLYLWPELPEEQKLSLIGLLEKADKMGTEHQKVLWQSIIDYSLTGQICASAKNIRWLGVQCGNVP